MIFFNVFVYRLNIGGQYLSIYFVIIQMSSVIVFLDVYTEYFCYIFFRGTTSGIIVDS